MAAGKSYDTCNCGNTSNTSVGCSLTYCLKKKGDMSYLGTVCGVKRRWESVVPPSCNVKQRTQTISAYTDVYCAMVEST